MKAVKHHRRTNSYAIAAAVMCATACGGRSSAPPGIAPGPTAGGGVSTANAAANADAAANAATERATPPAAPNTAPELVRRDVPDAVIAGREVYFGIDVVDEEFDRLRITLGAHPEGAELDARTMTIRWRVAATASGAQNFVVHVDETLENGVSRSHDLPLTITVASNAPVPGQAQVVPPLVGQLVTITARDYLARASQEFPITRVLEVARDAAVDAQSVENRPRVQTRTAADLFRDLLGTYAQMHANARFDPTSPSYDRRFDATNWRLVAVRPRMNKAVQELRLAYAPDGVPEPVFAMFRFRLFRGAAPSSPAVAQANNAAFTRLVHRAFWNGTALRAGIREGRAREVGTAVATLVRSVLTFRDPQNDALRTGLVAIPQEARMGGGSAFDAQGNYQTGNAWALTVANMVVADVNPGTQGGPLQPFVRTVPVSSFTFDVGPNTAGDAFTSVCPPRYRSGGAGNEPGLEALCERDGTVRIRERSAEGRWAAARRDSANEHRDIVAREMVERVGLRDVRRRNFEESGMTCVQCHMRNFDDGVIAEPQAGDPRVTTPITPARSVERVRMQILPVGLVVRSPWLQQQETAAICDMGRDIRTHANVDVGLPCPDGY